MTMNKAGDRIINPQSYLQNKAKFTCKFRIYFPVPYKEFSMFKYVSEYSYLIFMCKTFTELPSILPSAKLRQYFHQVMTLVRKCTARLSTGQFLMKTMSFLP